MDNVTVEEIKEVEEVEMNINDNKWILLNWNDKQKNNDEFTELLKIQEDLSDKIQITEVKDNDIKISCTNVESSNRSNDVPSESTKIQKDLDNEIQIIRDDDIEVLYKNERSDDISDDISVITESDTDNNNIDIKFFQNQQLNEYSRMWEMIGNGQTSATLYTYITAFMLSSLIFITFGFMWGYIYGSNLFYYHVTETFLNTSGICKNLQMELDMLHKNKAILIENKIYLEHVSQLLKNINSNEMNNKTIKESFNSNSYPLNKLQASLHLLSLISEIYDSNSSLAKNIDKTLDIVNNITTFYETLTLFENNIQNMDNFTVMQLQNTGDIISYTTLSLLSNAVKEINKTTLNIHNEMECTMLKLNEDLCHLKNTLPHSNEFIKQQIENNFLRNYNFSCSSNNKSENFNMNTKDVKINNTKKQTRDINDSTSHTEYEKNISRQNKMENDSRSTSKSYTAKQNNQQGEYMNQKKSQKNANWQFERSHARDQQRRIHNSGFFRVQSSNPKAKITRKRQKQKEYTNKKKSQKSADWQFERSHARDQQRRIHNSDFLGVQSSNRKTKITRKRRQAIRKLKRRSKDFLKASLKYFEDIRCYILDIRDVF